MLGISPTAYDLRFRLFGIPIRVHPMFWLAIAILTVREMKFWSLMLWMGCVFVSVLVHELGHGLLAKKYSNCREIVLYALGGLCFYSPEPKRPGQQLAITLAGPGAGFLLCLAFMALTTIAWGITPREHLSYAFWTLGAESLANREDLISLLSKLPILNLRANSSPQASFELYHNMVFINLMWGLVNLLPILPLDGGRVAATLLKLYNRSQGVRWSYIVSLLTSGIIAVYVMSWPGRPEIFLIMMFGSLAFMSYQNLQAIDQAQRLGIHDEEWWRG